MAPLLFNFLLYLLLSSQTLKACLWMSSRALLSSHPLLVSPPWPVHLLLDTPSWSIGAEAPVLWPPDVKSWLTEKDPDARKDWRQEEKGMTEDEMVGWRHWLNGHEFEHALGEGKGQGSLGCCSLGVTKSWTQLSNLTTATIPSLGCPCWRPTHLPRSRTNITSSMKALLMASIQNWCTPPLQLSGITVLILPFCACHPWSAICLNVSLLYYTTG